MLHLFGDEPPLQLALFLSTSVLTFVGDHCVEATPVPIPNTAVKLYSADGTAGAARWESTSSPASYGKPPDLQGSGAFRVPWNWKDDVVIVNMSRPAQATRLS